MINNRASWLAILVTIFLVLISGCSVPALPTSSSTPASPASQTPATTSARTESSAPPFSSAPAPQVTITPTPSPAPSGPNIELRRYMLELINKDRQAQGADPVVLAYNTASQKHADDMLANFYLSHWDTEGLKPYMRYTVAGGFNTESENSAYSGWFNKADNPDSYALVDAQKELGILEYRMMNDDAASNWGHRNTILNKMYKKVNIGIAYDKHRLALVQQFEGDYVQFAQLPVIAQNTLSLSGRINLGTFAAVALYYDPPPQAKTSQELNSGPRSYGLGNRVAQVIAPPPPGQYYSSVPADAIQASKWEVDQQSFSIQADVTPALAGGKGVYTIVVWSKVQGENKNLTNYSIFVR